MNNKEKILDLYYNQHLKQCEIAKQLELTKQYVSKIVKTDERYKQVKAKKKQESSKRRILYLKEYFKTYNRPKKDDTTYEQLLALQKQDSIEMSYYNNDISPYVFAKYNPNAYHTNSKGNLVLNKGLKVGDDIPKSIYMHLKIPTQKYKHRYCHSR